MSRRRGHDRHAEIQPTDGNLLVALDLLQALAHGLLPKSHKGWPVALLVADSDGHTKGDNRDFGDGPILWATVKLWHAINGRDRTRPAR